MTLEAKIFRLLIGALVVMVLLGLAVGVLLGAVKSLDDDQADLETQQDKLEHNQQLILQGQEEAKQRGYDARVAPCLVILLPPNDEPNPRTAIAEHPPPYCTIEPVLQRINQTLINAGLPPLTLQSTPEPS